MNGEYFVYLSEDCGGVTDGQLSELMLLLPADRRARAERYRRREAKLMCVMAWRLLEYALADCFGIREARVSAADTGKPRLEGAEGVFFSMSHSGYGCICAVARRELGADIQRRVMPSERLARRVCSRAEAELLGRADDPDAVFTDMWALKESYVKLTGEGISRGLGRVDTADFPARGELCRAGDAHIAVSLFPGQGEERGVSVMDGRRIAAVASEMLLPKSR